MENTVYSALVLSWNVYGMHTELIRSAISTRLRAEFIGALKITADLLLWWFNVDWQCTKRKKRSGEEDILKISKRLSNKAVKTQYTEKTILPEYLKIELNEKEQSDDRLVLQINITYAIRSRSCSQRLQVLLYIFQVLLLTKSLKIRLKSFLSCFFRNYLHVNGVASDATPLNRLSAGTVMS